MNKLKLLIISLLAICLCGCKDNNELVMVTEAGFAPYEFYEGGEVVGVDIEIAKEIAKDAGKKLVVKDIAFDSIINELQKGKADFAAAGLSITEERKKQVDFSIEYAVSKQVVMVRENSPLTKADQVYNYRAGIQIGSIADFDLSDHMNEKNIVRQKKYLSLVEDLKANKIDAIVMDSLPALEIIKQNSGLKLLNGELFTDKYGMAVKKGNDKLLNTINKTLQRLVDEGKIESWTIEYTK